MSGAGSAVIDPENDARAGAEKPDLRAMTYEQRVQHLADLIVADKLGSELRKRSVIQTLAVQFGVTPNAVRNYMRNAFVLLSANDDLEERRRLSIVTTESIRDTARDNGEDLVAIKAQQHLDSITGVQRREAPTVQVNIVQQNEMFRRLWDGIGEALAPYPDAARAVQAKFTEIMGDLAGGAKPTLRLPNVIDVEASE